ncbi:MAG: septum formation inhibitor Maf [Burkholderiales bacterium PBB5]|nr:MAG: septum formation inhibitor Maf [Burkholderiales bacterium PBB5]
MPEPTPFIYLASQSPRRAQLLDQLGVAHQLLLPDADEDAEALEAVLPGESPAAYVQRVTALKLAAARRRLRRRGGPPAPILCADTTVAVGRRILGKPADADEARAMLSALSGRAHKVHTAVAVAPTPTARRTLAALSTSTVRFAELPAAAIAAYIASGEPFGKAGAYAIQSAWAGRIAHIAGSYTGIMGLPLFETADLLRQARVAC